MRRPGFTLIELIAVMVVLAVLAGIAAPRFFDLADDANESVYESTVGAVREAARGVMMANAVGSLPNPDDYPEFNEHGALVHLGDESPNEDTLFDAILDTPVRVPPPGKPGFRYDSRFSGTLFDLYYWDADGNGVFNISFFGNGQSDRYMLYFKEPIGRYQAGTVFVWDPNSR